MGRGPSKRNATRTATLSQKESAKASARSVSMSSPLEVFRSDEAVVKDLTDAESLEAFNFWETQEQSCPVTIARSVSPCYESYCQSYKSSAERTQCRDAATSYCNVSMP